MHNKSESIIKYLKNHGGVARTSSIREAGFHPSLLAASVKEGKIEKIGKGLYKLFGEDFAGHSDLIVSLLQAPQGVICLISALSFYEVTDEIPRRVDVAIMRGTRTNKIKYPPVNFYRFAPIAWNAGVEEHRIGNHTIKVYSLAKTIADCFKFRNKIGIDVARAALKAAISQKGISPKEIMRYAKICRVTNIIKPVLEAII